MHSISAQCNQIQAILDIAKENKILIFEVYEGWSESKISFDMDTPLNDNLRDYLIKKYPSLKYVEYEGSLHDKPYRGFKCLTCSETVIFNEV